MDALVNWLCNLIGIDYTGFYHVLEGSYNENPSWDYGMMFVYFCCTCIIIVVIRGVFSVIKELFKRKGY